MLLLKRILVHPATVSILFCFIIISGEATGYFYLTLLMLGLSHALLHSILGIGGLILILFSINNKHILLSSVLRLLGAACLLLSLLRFFTQPGASYNYPTFQQFVPLVTLILFLLSLLLFIVNQLQLLGSKSKQ
jgi:hypothetical protein